MSFTLNKMHIETELDTLHSERLQQLQQHLQQPLTTIIAQIVAKAIDDTFMSTEVEGQKILNIMTQRGLLGCMEGDGNLSTDYKRHLWKSE